VLNRWIFRSIASNCRCRPADAFVRSRCRATRATAERSPILDTDLINRVIHELYWDPSIDQAAIAVSAADGAVTLRGTVGGLAERRWTKQAAARVAGVRFIHDHLVVGHLSCRGHVDARLRGRVLQAFVLSSAIPATLDAWVTRKFVTLTGSVTRQLQREEAKALALSVPGVTGILDETLLERP
jgi:osmotically-inducible protein OsmY